ncbi:hypothetical protein BBJ28_00019109 [Nothophytophthora sp. Chile5]|nr:hypothetical protein BBJ28_00019109 [Nothophytophthora sp. Chile5]
MRLYRGMYAQRVRDSHSHFDIRRSGADESNRAAMSSRLDDEALTNVLADMNAICPPPSKLSLDSTLLERLRWEGDVDDHTQKDIPSGSEHEISTTAGVTDTQSSSGTKEARPKRKKKRTRPPVQIALLKTEAGEMERKLQKLQELAVESGLQARIDNRAMKQKLQRHRAWMAVLGQSLVSHVSQAVALQPSSLVVTGRNLPFDAANDAAAYRMLAQNLDERYGSMGSVFEAAGLWGATAESNAAEVYQPTYTSEIKGSSGDCVLKTRVSGLLPFLDVSETMWHMMESESVAINDQDRLRALNLQLGLASRIVVTKREVVFRGGDTSSNASCTVRTVVKRYIDKDRVVDVWDAIADWPGVDDAPRVSTRECGWGLVQPMEGAGLSIVQHCIVMKPTIAATGTAESESFDFVVRMYQHLTNSLFRRLENKLMDQSVRSKRGTRVGSGC